MQYFSYFDEYELQANVSLGKFFSCDSKTM